MKPLSLIAIFGIFAALLLSSCKRLDSDGATQWEYKIVLWNEFYCPLMKEIQNEGKVKYFTDDKDASWMIIDGSEADFVLRQRTPEYLKTQLNNYGKDGWELASTVGEKRNVTYIFKRKR